MSRIHSQKNGALNEQDRLSLAQLLIKAGYTVRLGKMKESQAQNAKAILYVEYLEDDKSSEK